MDMNVEDAYRIWSEQYDSNANKTRDLEAVALRECLSAIQFESCLEIGCGTGKNTEWLAGRAKRVVAVDLSASMIEKAREKLAGRNVEFVQANILQDWKFVREKFDLISFSLVLEHIENLQPIFAKASELLKDDGYLFMGELHPFKQYGGVKARFETPSGLQIVECYNHHISDFVNAAHESGLKLFELKEYFDDEDRSSVPRILAMIFQMK